MFEKPSEFSTPEVAGESGSETVSDETDVEKVFERSSEEDKDYGDRAGRSDEENGSGRSQESLNHQLFPREGTQPSLHRRSTSTTYPPMPLKREIPFVLICISAQLFTQASLAQAIAPLHIIGDSFGSPSPGQLSWFAASYSLTVGTFILIAGRMGDMIGHKTLFIFGFVWYALWSLVAGCSVWTHSQIFFDFCRAMQGIGPAVLLPCSLALVGGTYQPGRRKEMVFALYGAAAPNGFILGSVFSSLVAQRLWWPWAYWLMSIACLALGFAAWFIIPEQSDDTSSRGPQSFDWLGAITGIAGLVLFNVAWNQAPIVGWGEPYVIVCLILGVAFFVAFVVVEKRVRQPLLPLEGLGTNVAFVLGCIGLGWSSFGIWLYYQWQFLSELRHYSPLAISAQNSPPGISGFCAALATGYLLSRIPAGYIMCISMTAFCVGNILLATMPIHQTYWAQTFVSNVITPWGMDMSFPSATLILSNSMPKRHQGIAASLVATVVNYSISIGLGIGGTVESHVNEGGLTPEGLLKGYRGAWYSGIGLSGCGILLSLYFIVHGHREKAKAKRT